MENKYLEMEEEAILINRVCEELRDEEKENIKKLENDFNQAKELFAKSVMIVEEYQDRMLKEITKRSNIEIKKAGYNYGISDSSTRSEDNKIVLDEWYDNEDGNYQIISDELYEDHFDFFEIINDRKIRTN